MGQFDPDVFTIIIIYVKVVRDLVMKMVLNIHCNSTCSFLCWYMDEFILWYEYINLGFRESQY